MTSKIKLDYPVLAPSHQVWMVRPGADYRLLQAFVSSSAFGPDVPLLKLRDGGTAQSSKDLDQQVRRGRAWRDWEKEGNRKSRRPAKGLRSYLSEDDDGISHTRSKNVVIQILDSIPEGSLVFVPASSLSEFALLGVAAAPSMVRAPIEYRAATGQSMDFLGRSLLNPIKVPMRLLPPDVTDLRKNRGVIAGLVDKEDARDRLYKEYFGSFALFGGGAYAQFRGGDSPFPAGAVGTLATLMRLVLEARIEDEEARLDGRALTKIGAARLARLTWSTNADLLIHARVNSPFGRITFQSSKSAIFAAIGLTALAGLNSDAQVVADLENQTTQVENVCDSPASVGVAAQEQADEIRQTLYDFYAIFGARTCLQVLEALRETVEATDGRVDAEAEQ